MDENKHDTKSMSCRSQCCCSALPFILGVIIALAFGWWIFPGLMFKEEPQPFFFTHKTHVEELGLSCDSCHFFRDDGSFSGLPRLDACTSCHSGLDALQTPEPVDEHTKRARDAELAFVTQYVEKEQEVPWKAHQRQPDNVFFSHAAHFNKCFTCHLTMKGRLNFGTPEEPQRLCQQCHLSLDELDKNRAVPVNVLTGYTDSTIKMAQCEHCHAFPGHFNNDGKGRTNANNACFTCHK